MGLPRFLAENLFDGTQFRDATVSANEEATGHEAFRVGTRRRTPLNFWTPTTENQDAWVKVDLGSGNSEAADMIAIDRGHNLDGETVTLEHSSDDSTWTQAFSVTMPANEGDNTSLTATNGVKTEEGAWVFAFTSATDRYWRLTVSAMGAGLKPEIRGLYLGESYAPNFHIALPFGYGDVTAQFSEVQGPNVWAGASRVSTRKERTFRLKLKSWAEYHDTARYHIEELFFTGVPMWCVFDVDYAERAWLAKVQPGTSGFQRQQGWGFPQSELRAAEHQPAQ